MNDPNGFSFFGGHVHLFYQYNPYELTWGNIHWGHCVSDDFLTWEDLAVALAPDEEYDRGGCFSGSALERDGRHVLMYTSVRNENGRWIQEQSLAAGDGVTYAKTPDNPVLPAACLPDGYARTDFRDPRIYAEPEGFALVAAALGPDGNGRVLKFRSHDLSSWSLSGALAGDDGRYRGMIECPEYFGLDEKQVLMLSVPNLGQQIDDAWPKASGVVVETGTEEQGVFRRQDQHLLDHGRDFYAAQTMLHPDGRRILIAWMQSGFGLNRPASVPWQGMMSCPRELTLCSGTVLQQPVREVAQARTDHVHVAATVHERTRFRGVEGRALDLVMHVCAASPCSSFSVHLAEAGDRSVSLSWDPREGTLTFRRDTGSLPPAAGPDAHAVQTVRLAPGTDVLDLRLLVDLYSAEAFVDGGRYVFTSTYYAPPDAVGVSFEANGGVFLELDKYRVSPQGRIGPVKRSRPV